MLDFAIQIHALWFVVVNSRLQKLLEFCDGSFRKVWVFKIVDNQSECGFEVSLSYVWQNQLFQFWLALFNLEDREQKLQQIRNCL